MLNHSPDKMHVVTLKLPDTSYNIDLNRIRDITRSVVVGPGSTAHVSLFQPPVPLHGNDVAVAIDGRLQREAVPLSLGNHAPDMSHSFASHFMLGSMGSISLPLSLQVLVSRNIDTSEFHAHVGKLVKSIPTMSGFSFLTSTSGSVVTSSSSSSSTGSASYELIDLGFPVSAWSTEWLGFSRYDGIVVTNEDIQQMPSDVQAALWEYVECGGALLVLGGNNLPDNWASGAEMSNKSAGMSVNRVGFGEFFISTETDTTSLNQTQWRQIVHSWVKTATPWQSQLSIAEANNRFPVVDDFGVPVTRVVPADACLRDRDWANEPYCALAEKAPHLDVVDCPGDFADDLFCSVPLCNLCRRVESIHPNRGSNDSRPKGQPRHEHRRDCILFGFNARRRIALWL